MIKEKLSGYNRSIQVASGWFLVEELPYDFFATLGSEEEIDKWIGNRMVEDYEHWTVDYIWQQIESLAYILRSYDETENLE